MAAPREIADGIFHWTTIHPVIRIRVSSYYLPAARVLLDPLVPSTGGLPWLRRQGPPEHVLLTTGLHSRHSAELVEAFGCAVWCPAAGLRRLAPSLARHARPYAGGDRLPGDIRAVEIGVLCPDEFALHLPRVRAAAIADGAIRLGNGPLTFVPDELLVDDPRDLDKVKRGLRAAYRRLARRQFDHLLLAHGNPWLDDGRDALRAWAAARQ